MLSICHFFATTCSRIPNITFIGHIVFSGLLYSHRHFSLFYFLFELHLLQSNLHLHSNDICFVNGFDSFFSVIKLKMLRFKSSILFETYALLDRLLGVLQLQTHLSKLILNEYYCNPWVYSVGCNLTRLMCITKYLRKHILHG